ncbi:hypothetical protein [Edaphobacter albus]|uniref:hypothetical protein n=1 Tax=Edaphobacter sp. 4G125 TaxID=2763071 RepID=UPI001646A557|nr:hypothetical protein [Edaphobacter sp. 4G125]QNI35462.1 hypothetical protein H7846_10255 [Edaphobacter sp. 4G125]
MFICFGRSRGLSSEVRKAVFVGLVGIALSQTAIAQSPAPDSNAIVSRANQAFSAGKPVTSVEMTGRAEWTAGSTKDSGPAKLTANVNGENKAEFDLSNGTRIESQSAIAEDRTCTWSGKDGVEHDVSVANCWTATIWFLPQLALQGSGQPSMLSVQSIDETHLRHQVTFNSKVASSRPVVADLYSRMQKWSQTDLTLDPATALPSSLKYTIHPDQNSFANIQVEVRYSKYQNVSGVEIPMHIERYINGSLQLSIDIDSAVIS